MIQVGYTKDGLVFLQVMSTYEEKPMQTVVQLQPPDAKSLCKDILNAAKMAEETKEANN